MNIDRSSILRAALRTLAITATPLAVHAQNSISINFGANENTGTVSNASALTAGAIPIAGTFWNNMSGATQAVAQPLNNNLGAPSGASVTWSSANTWRSGSTGGTATSLNGNLTKGYLDDGGSGAIVNVANVPYLAYDVYVIRGSDQGGATNNGNANYRPVSVNGINYQGNEPLNTVSTATIVGGAQTTGYNWTNNDVLLDGRNFHHAPSQAGLNLSVRGNTGSGRGPIAGLQIVNTYTGTLRYWDVNGGDPGAVGVTPSGTWDDTTANWNDSAGTGTPVTWTDSNEAAVFSAGTDVTGPYTVAVSGTRTTDAVILEEGDLTLSGGTLNLVNAGIMRAFTPGGTLTIDSTIASAGNVAFEGAGSIVLNGTASHTGATNVSTGFTLGATGAIDSTASFNIATGVTAIVDGEITTTGPVNLSGSSLLGEGTIVAGGDVNLSNLGTTNNLTLAGDGSLSTATGSILLNRGAITLNGNASVSAANFYTRVAGTVDLSINDSASLDVSGFMVLGDNTGAAINVNQTGGSMTNTGTTNNPGGNSMSNRWGHWGGGATTVYNLSGGSLNLTGAPLYLSWDSPATLNISGTGVANLKGIDMGFGGREQVSTINLAAGGILNIGSAGILSSGTAEKVINLSGGTLGATENWTATAPMNVLAATAVDTGAFNVALNGALGGAGGITKTGSGTLALGGTNSYAGPTNANEGTLRLGAATTGGVNIAATATLGSDVGSTVDTVNLANGSSLVFRIGDAADSLVVTTAGGLTTDTAHSIDILGGFGLSTGTYTLIDYDTSISGTGFAALSLGSLPHITASLNHNVAETSVELVITDVDTLVWTGDNGSDWDLNSSVNWFLANGATDAPYFQSDLVEFDDSASTGSVNLVGTISPGDVFINNSSLDYTFTGTGIQGGTDFIKQGGAKVTLLNPNTFTGSTVVGGGILQVGDGTSGSLSAVSQVVISPGAELVVIPAADGDFANPVFNEGILRIGGSSDIGLTGVYDNPNPGDIVVDSTGITSFTTGKPNWTGNLTANAGTVRTTGFATSSMGQGSNARTLTFEAGTTFSMEQNNIFGGGGTDLALVPAIVLNGATLTTTRYNLLGNIELNGATITGAPTDGPGDYEGYEMRGTYTVTGSSPSLIEIQNDRLNHFDVATTFNVAEVTSDAATDLLVTAPFKNATPDNGSVIGGFVKTGAGTMEMTAANLFTGTTEVQAGRVAVTGDGSTTSSLIQVDAGAFFDVTGNNVSPFPLAAGQTIAGAGSFVGSFNLAGGVSPGASAGSLAVSGTLALLGGSTYTWEVSNWTAAGVAGTDFDTIVAGNLDVQANAGTPMTIVITPDAIPNFTEADRTFDIASATGSITGFATDAFVIDDAAFVTATGATGSWSIAQDGGSIALTYTAGAADAYGAFEAANGIAGAGADTDSDLDTIANGIEFVIGGDPSGPASDSHSLLPTTTIDATYLNFTFRRTDDSASYNPLVEYGNNLTGWSEAQAGVDGVIVNETDDDFGAGVDRVEVRIPRSLAAGNKFFARLRVDIP